MAKREWLVDGSLVYTLGYINGDLQNTNEINLSMVDGSRSKEVRNAAAIELAAHLNLLGSASGAVVNAMTGAVENG
jgi:hypothetical protein